MAISLFEIGKEYKRSEIHDQHGGSRQAGISNSAKAPYIFIFSNESGSKYGYSDGWLNDHIFSYTGAGQTGDMEFKRSNLALKNHIINRKRDILFQESKKSYVEFVAELELDTTDFFDGYDLNGNIRKAIKFFFRTIDPNQNKYQIPASLSKAKDSASPAYSNKHVFTKTEKENWVTSRVGQGAFRQSVLYRWNFKCAVTGYDDPNILIASHIVAWKDSKDIERLDVNNGILLSPAYDALFDKHLISFDDRGSIILSNRIKEKEYGRLGITGNEKVYGLSSGNLGYLARHRALLV